MPSDAGEGGGGDLVPLGSRHGGLEEGLPAGDQRSGAVRAWRNAAIEVLRYWRRGCARCAGDLCAGAQMGFCGPRWARADLAPFSRLLGPWRWSSAGDAAWPCRCLPGGCVQLPSAAAAAVAAAMQVPLDLVWHHWCSGLGFRASRRWLVGALAALGPLPGHCSVLPLVRFRRRPLASFLSGGVVP
jgi:hypothetical protein